MVGLNAVRLVLGTVLDVSEDGTPTLDADDPHAPAWAVYEFLGGVVDAAVQRARRDPRLTGDRSAPPAGVAGPPAAELLHRSGR